MFIDININFRTVHGGTGPGLEDVLAQFWPFAIATFTVQLCTTLSVSTIDVCTYMRRSRPYMPPSVHLKVTFTNLNVCFFVLLPSEYDPSDVPIDVH